MAFTISFEDPSMDDEESCLREFDGTGWQCINDHTGCIWNDGNNTCSHEGTDKSPLGTPDQPDESDYSFNATAEEEEYVRNSWDDIYEGGAMEDDYDYAASDLAYDSWRESH